MSLLSQSETAATDIILPLRSGNGDSSFSEALVQAGCYRTPFPEQSIHLREKQKQVLPCEIKKAFAFLSSQKGPAFFDEDDVCDGF